MSRTSQSDLSALDDTISWLSSQKESINRQKVSTASTGTSTGTSTRSSKSSSFSIWWIIGAIAIVLILIFVVIYFFGSKDGGATVLQGVTGAAANGIIPEGNIIFMEVGTKNAVPRENVVAGDYKIVN